MGMDVYGLNPNLKSKRPDIDWSVATEEERKEYFNTLDQWHADNRGAYFRNNVWWWHPLWTYVCHICDDMLSEETKNLGHSNDGHQIDDATATDIANRLLREIETGKTEAYATAYEAERSQLDDDDSDKNYPFSTDNVKEFEIFCRLSGGFEIC